MNTLKAPRLEAITVDQEDGELRKWIPATCPIKTSATARLAPELRPSTSGPARAFRNSVCICKPPMESAPPAKTQVRALVVLKSQTMFIHTSLVLSPCTIMVKISDRGMLTLPRERFTVNNITRSDCRKIQLERVLNDDIGISNPDNDKRFSAKCRVLRVARAGISKNFET
jgi:hypothetical protein